MSHQPHPDSEQITVNCAIITVSDTRSLSTDRSGKRIKELLLNAGHAVVVYEIINS